jgi:16S rRNA G966 N2-methylase RsmD
MHRYWARKPYNIVADYINYFSDEGDIVLDPFCGSGVTAIEALVLKRKAIAVDLDPVATFITRNTGAPVEINKLRDAFHELERKVENRINFLYETQCLNCQGIAIIQNTLWKDKIPTKITYKCTKCHTRGKREVSQQDLAKIHEINTSPVPFWYPDDELMANSRINVHKGMRIADLFTKRNLMALSILWNGIQELQFDDSTRDLLRFTFTASISQASRMVFVIRRRGRLNGTVGESNADKEEIGSRAIGYWIPSENFEINAWNCFENRFKRVLHGKEQTNELIGTYYRQAENLEDLVKGNKTILIQTRSATDVTFLGSDSVDYIFTDPPYGDHVPYMELDKLWASWLEFDLDFENEIVISDSKDRDKKLPQYKDNLAKAIKQMHNVLKTGKFMSVCFYNYDFKVWHALMSACVDVGFEKVNILPIGASHPSIVQLFRPGGSKGALVITFKKLAEKKPSPKSPASQDDIDRMIIEAATKLIVEKGDAAMHEIYDKVITILIENNALDMETNILRLMKDKFVQVNGKWKIGTS